MGSRRDDVRAKLQRTMDFEREELDILADAVEAALREREASVLHEIGPLTVVGTDFALRFLRVLRGDTADG